MSRRNTERVLYGVAFGLGLLIGYNDLHNTEVQAAALSILIVTFGFGLFKPHHAWRWALLVGLGVPLIHLVSFVVPMQPAFQVNWPTTFVALIPAFLGVYAGALIRWAALEGDNGR